MGIVKEIHSFRGNQKKTIDVCLCVKSRHRGEDSFYFDEF